MVAGKGRQPLLHEHATKQSARHMVVQIHPPTVMTSA